MISGGSRDPIFAGGAHVVQVRPVLLGRGRPRRLRYRRWSLLRRGRGDGGAADGLVRPPGPIALLRLYPVFLVGKLHVRHPCKPTNAADQSISALLGTDRLGGSQFRTARFLHRARAIRVCRCATHGARFAENRKVKVMAFANRSGSNVIRLSTSCVLPVVDSSTSR